MNINANIKRLFVAATIGLILLELNTINLLLWPLDHSCARPANLSLFSKLFVDSARQQIDLDAVQTNLLDATPEDSFTVARAKSLGINYDDIAHCFQYPVEYDNKTGHETVNMESLEPCRHGLHFEPWPMGPELNVLAYFKLACSRQWLKILLAQFAAFGMALGVIWCYLIRSRLLIGSNQDIINGGSMPTKSNLWHCWQLLASSFISLIVAHQLDQWLAETYHQTVNEPRFVQKGGGDHTDEFLLLLATISLRSFANWLLLDRVLNHWTIEPSESSQMYGDEYRQLRENHIYFVALVTSLTIFKALFVPLALRLSLDWAQMNQLLTAVSIGSVSLALACEIIVWARRWLWLALGQLGRSGNLISSESRSEHSNATLWLRGSADDGEEEEQVSEVGDDHHHHHHHHHKSAIGYEKQTGRVTNFVGQTEGRRGGRQSSAKVCEFCLMREPPAEIYSLAMNHPYQREQQREKRQRQQQQTKAIVGDDSSPALDDLNNAYRPTTLPIDCRFGHDELSGSPAGDRSDSSTSHRQFGGKSSTGGPDLIASPSGRPPPPRGRHNWLALERVRFSLQSQLALLTFALAFNYFLLELMPNHRLLHAESISSLMRRKISHRKATARISSSGLPSSSPLEAATKAAAIVSADATSIGADDVVALADGTLLSTTPIYRLLDGNRSRPKRPNEGGPTAGNKPASDPFNYARVDYSTQTIEALRDSSQAWRVIAKTAALTGWPVELFVLFLYNAPWTARLELELFKLSHLFSPVTFGTRLLLVEWLLIALLRSQNHLLEWDWLLAGALLFARLIVSLMLYANCHVLLRLARKLGPSNRLVSLATGGSSALVALWLASFVPLWERFDLITIPLALLANNALANWLARQVARKLQRALCPMIFEERL